MRDKVNENMNREERKNFKEFLSKVRIVPEDQPIDDMTLVAGRIKDVPIPLVPSGTRKCGYCKETVWVETKLLDKADKAQQYVYKTLDIISDLNPTFYFIENPRGMLRKLLILKDVPYRHTVTYCRYGDSRMKPTDIWTNCPYFVPKYMCTNGCPNHERAPRGSSTGTQGIKSYEDRSRVPKELCEDILMTIENIKEKVLL